MRNATQDILRVKNRGISIDAGSSEATLKICLAVRQIRMYGKLVDGTAHLARLRNVISEAPPGRAKWRARWALADAFVVAGQAEEALAEYIVAIEETEASGDQNELTTLLHDAAHAACDAGHFEMARVWYQRSLACEKAATGSRLARIAGELEMARMDVLRGLWDTAKEVVERHLGELRSLWQTRVEVIDAETGNHDELKRVFLGAIDIARQLVMGFERWSKALELLDEMDALLVDSPFERARVRLNRIDPLLEIAKRRSGPSLAFAQRNEARQIALECISSFQEAGAVGDEAQACGLLARIESRCGNYKDAVSWAQRGFVLAPAIVEPWNRMVMHDNMAVYCHNAGHREETGEHWLVAVIIRIAAGFSIQQSKYSLDMHRRCQRGIVVYRVKELIERPGYAYVGPFLHRLGASVEAVQAVVDEILGNRGGPPSGGPLTAEVMAESRYASRTIFVDKFELPTYAELQAKDESPESETRRKREPEDAPA